MNVYLMYICKNKIMYINTKSYKNYCLSKRITRFLTILFAVGSLILFLEVKDVSIWFNLLLVIILSLFLYYGITSIFYLYYSTTSIDDPPLITGNDITGYEDITKLKQYPTDKNVPNTSRHRNREND